MKVTRPTIKAIILGINIQLNASSFCPVLPWQASDDLNQEDKCVYNQIRTKTSKCLSRVLGRHATYNSTTGTQNSAQFD